MVVSSRAMAIEATQKELTLAQVVQLAEKISPSLRASRSREIETSASLSVSKSYLYPTLDLSAVDSFGFAGSSGPTPPEFGGILNSPYRVGPGVGVVTRFTLFDLGNWHAVDAAQEDLHASEEDAKITRLKVDQAALSSFLEAARARGDLEVWKDITSKVEDVEKSLKRLVKTGQYSDVSRLLIKDQVDEARMNWLAFDERYKQAVKRLAMLTGLNENTIVCPTASSLDERSLNFLQPNIRSPLVSHAAAELKAAHFHASEAESKHLPKVYAAASAGYLNDTRLVPSQNYSAWVGVTLPLFEGFRISSEAQRARAVADEKESRLSAVQLDLDETNTRYDETINIARLELKLLKDQHETALRAFALARQRYLAFLGTVIDLREALRNIARIESQINARRAELLLALGSKAVLNGSSFGMENKNE